MYARLFALNGLGATDVARFGLQALERISAYAPELGTEIEGIAAGSGLPAETIGALNARTELLAASAGECSTIACLGSMTASGSALGIQTWDWHNELAEGWIVWTIEHPDGRRVETLTEAGIVGKIGMNDRGVAVLLNILGHRDDGPPVGVPIHVLCRSVLDQADGAVTALEMVAAADVSASSAVTIVTDEEGGTACSVEVSPAGPGFVDAGRPRRPRPHEPLPRAPRPRRRIGRPRRARARSCASTSPGDGWRRCPPGRSPPTPSSPPWRRIAAARARCAAIPSPARRSETGGRPSPPWSPSPPSASCVVYRGGPCQIAAASTIAAAARQ